MVSRSVECIYAQECDAGRKYGVSVVPPGCAGLVYFWGRNSSEKAFGSTYICDLLLLPSKSIVFHLHILEIRNRIQ